MVSGHNHCLRARLYIILKQHTYSLSSFMPLTLPSIFPYWLACLLRMLHTASIANILAPAVSFVRNTFPVSPWLITHLYTNYMFIFRLKSSYLSYYLCSYPCVSISLYCFTFHYSVYHNIWLLTYYLDKPSHKKIRGNIYTLLSQQMKNVWSSKLSTHNYLLN